MKKVILGTAVLLALLTGCTEEKKAPVEQATQEVKKDEVTPVQVTEEVKKDEAPAVEEETIKEETVKEESK